MNGNERTAKQPTAGVNNGNDTDQPNGQSTSLDDARSELDATRDKLLRAQADFDNYRKRIEKERLDAIPWTRFSLAAEKKLEREGETSGARAQGSSGKNSSVDHSGR